MDDAQLRTVWQQRQAHDRTAHVSQPLAMLVKRTLAKRVHQLGKLAEVWDDLIPQSIREHTALESFSAGTLTVAVDSAPHRCQLQMLLDAGLRAEIQSRLGVALNRIRLVPGQFYSVDLAGGLRYHF